MSPPSDSGRPHKNRLISRRKVRDFLAAHPGSVRHGAALERWCKQAEGGDWTSFAKVRESCPTADQVGDLIVFNVAGNSLRVVAEVQYNLKPRIVYLRHVLTHREYDDGRWKD